MLHCGDPQLTAPCNVHEPFEFWQTNGPPLSPWQPDWLAETSVFAAHNIWSVILVYVFFLAHEALSWMVNANCCKNRTEYPGWVIFPHPVKRITMWLQYQHLTSPISRVPTHLLFAFIIHLIPLFNSLSNLKCIPFCLVYRCKIVYSLLFLLSIFDPFSFKQARIQRYRTTKRRRAYLTI